MPTSRTMMLRSHLALEANRTSATLYVRGYLDPLAVAPIRDLLRWLPPDVRALRIDLCALAVLDAAACDALFDLIDTWRRSRTGVTRVVPLLPRAPRRPETRLATAPPSVGTPSVGTPSVGTPTLAERRRRDLFVAGT